MNTDRDGVMQWAHEQAKIETEKYKKENKTKTTLIPFHSHRQLDYNQQKFYTGGYLFLQSVYYELGLHKVCRKIRTKHNYKYDLNSVLSGLIFSRILNPDRKRSSFKSARSFMEAPSYKLHDVYRALNVLAEECGLIQSEAYKNSHFVTDRCDKILYYDCTNYYFGISRENGSRKYGKSKEHRPNPEEFGCDKFIYRGDAGPASESIREFNHMGKRVFLVTQSIKKLKKEEKEWALNPKNFKRISDHKTMDISNLPEDEEEALFYKDEPYSTGRLHEVCGFRADYQFITKQKMKMRMYMTGQEMNIWGLPSVGRKRRSAN